MKTVIMAGGRGTRMASLSKNLPKPMLPLSGKPILEREIEVLVSQGLSDIILVIGYLGDAIQSYFGDGAKFGAHITYLKEVNPLGTAGALALLMDALADDDFLLLNGDLLFDVDLTRFLTHHRKTGAIATIFTHPSQHPHDSVLVACDEHDRVGAFLPPDQPRPATANRTNAGLHFFSPAILNGFDKVQKTDLDREILAPLAAKGALFAYHSPEYVKDVGTPERLAEAERDLAAGAVARGNLAKPQRAIFLDRDGTVNRHVGFVTSPDEIELLPGAAEAIGRLNDRHIPVILVTNQPVVARGEVTREGLCAIHAQLEALLGEKGAYLTDIFVCPHHPDGGFTGEVAALKRPCDCRKPSPGLLLAAAQKYNISLCDSYMIGDSERDIEAGRRAGCRTAAIGTLHADITGTDLLDCINQILKNEVF